MAPTKTAKKPAKKKPTKTKPKKATAPAKELMAASKGLAGFANALNRIHGDEAAALGDTQNSGDRDLFETGFAPLDRYVFGCGGMPWGRIVELFGSESSGKTTLACRLIAAAQRAGHVGAYFDAEHSFDPLWAQAHGVDLERLIQVRPERMFLDGPGGMLHRISAMCAVAMNQQQRVLMVVDSVASCATLREVTEGLDKSAAVAEQARHWSHGLRILCEQIHRAGCTLLLLNQQRANIGTTFGSTTTTPGGNAIRYYSSLRLKLWAQNTPAKDGKIVNVNAVKNKMGPPLRTAQLRMKFDGSFDDKWAILNHAKDQGYVSKDCRSYKIAVNALGWFDLLDPEDIPPPPPAEEV